MDIDKSIGRLVHPGESYAGAQGPRYTPGISTESVGAQALWVGSVYAASAGWPDESAHP